MQQCEQEEDKEKHDQMDSIELRTLLKSIT